MENYINKPQKNYTQQLLNKELFQGRPRSLSFSGCSSNVAQPQHVESPGELPRSSGSTENQLDNHPQQQKDEQPSNQWQQDRVPNKKRKLHGSPTESASKKTNLHQVNYKVPVQNQFDVLSEEVPETTNKEYIPKPEPIFVTGVVNITPLRELIVKVVAIEKFTMTTLRSGHIIKLMPADIDSYKTIRDNLILNNINHYTYKLKSERAYRVVIRGLHATESTDIIKEELQAKGHLVRQIVNVLHRVTKEKLPLYFIDLEPHINNKDVFNIKYINNVKVTIEAPYKKKEVLQCKRCQRFGHSKNQCFRPFRCVKCGNDHPTNTCTKTPDTEAACANCQGKHPASYKGCMKYKQYKEKILKLKPTQQPKDVHVTSHLKHSTNVTNQHPTQDKSESNKSTPYTVPTYANVLKKRRDDPPQPSNPELDASQQNITNLLDTMFDRFQAIMKNMMDSMIDQMIKLITRLTTQRD